MSYKLYFLTCFAIFKHWSHKPLQLFLMLIGLATATTLWNSVQLINTEAKKAYAEAQTISAMSSKKILVSKFGLDFSDSHFGELRKKGWLVTPRIQGKITTNLGKNDTAITVIGIDPLTASREKQVNAFPPEFSLDKFLQGNRVILAGPKTSKSLSTNKHFNNIQPSYNFPEGYVLTDISIAQRILNKNNKLTSLEFTGPIPNNIEEIEIRGLKIKFNENDIDLESLTKSFHLNLTAFGLLSYLVSLFIVYSTINLAFEQRKGILKALRSLGLSSIAITSFMIFEVLVISIVATAIGTGLSYFLASALLPDVAITLNGLFGAKLNNSISLDIIFWLRSLCISVFGAICSAVPTLWKSFKLSPIDSAKKIAWFQETITNLKYQLTLAIIIITASIFALKFGSGVINAFFLLAGALVSTTLLLPIFLWIILSLSLRYQFKSSLIKWFFSDCKQQINSLSVSLMALLLALAVNIGVGGMVESFRKTFNGWLDQRLASELYIRSSNLTVSSEVREVLDGKVDAILPIVRIPQNISNIPSDIYGFIPHQTYEDHWPLIFQEKEVWSEIKDNKGVIINEQLSRRLALEISDRIEFETKIGTPISLKILGIYSDYGNPKGQLMLPLTLFNEYFPNEPVLSFAIRLPKKSISKIKKNLNETFSKGDLIITDQNEVKNISTKIFEKTFNITAALSILTLGIAGMALFTSITTLGDNRQAQIAPVWSIGTKRNTLAFLEALRSISLAILTFIFAVPIGIAVVFILTNYVNLEAFGWKLPIFFFPLQWLSLFIVTILITLFATFLHSVKLSKASPGELLKAAQYDT